MARTQEQRKADTRERLLAAASELFAQRGFHAVSTEAVAEAADRTSGAVYAHFGGKEGLLLALVNAAENAAAAEVTDALADAGDLQSRLSALWRSVSAAADGPADAWMLLEHELWLFAARNPEAGSGLAARYGVARSAMAPAFATWAEDEGTALPLAADDTASLVLALLFGLEMQRRVDPAAVPDDLAMAGLRLVLGVPADASG